MAPRGVFICKHKPCYCTNWEAQHLCKLAVRFENFAKVPINLAMIPYSIDIQYKVQGHIDKQRALVLGPGGGYHATSTAIVQISNFDSARLDAIQTHPRAKGVCGKKVSTHYGHS